MKVEIVMLNKKHLQDKKNEFFLMNVGTVLLNFPLIYKIFSKSLSKCENKGKVLKKKLKFF